jgi:hypothetical protein
MYVYFRHGAALLIVTATLLVAGRSHAWLETTLRSHVATVDVNRDGRAVVTTEILMQVRGGPLRSFELSGVDTDAQPLPDGTVASAKPSQGGSDAVPLRVEAAGGSLTVHVESDKGLRYGLYVFRFRYSTSLLARVQQTKGRLRLAWMGPRLPDGVDSARVVFRVPAAEPPPTLPAVDLAHPGLGLREEAGGVFVSNLRRAAEKDELEIMRLHVARGEPVSWRFELAPSALDGFAPAQPVAKAPLEATAAPLRPWAVLSAVMALFFALLVTLKHRLVASAASGAFAKARLLVPLRIRLRAPLAGLLLGAATALGGLFDQIIGAAVLIVLAMATAAHAGFDAEPRLRGPGRWQAVSPRVAFVKDGTKSGARWLDSGTLPGFALFCLALGAIFALAFRELSTSPHRAMLVAMLAGPVLPLFCTGRAAELPPDPVVFAQPLLRWLMRKLRRQQGVRAVPWGRMPDGSTALDELRLLVMPDRSLPGLLSIEIGLEYQQGGGGPVALPCILLRALDASAAYRAVPRSVVWTRGRRPEERVAVVRPTLPTRAQCLSLVRRLVSILSVTEAASVGAPHSSSKRASSSGSGSVTANPGMPSAPAHAM